MNELDSLLALPSWALVAIGVLALVQIGLAVYSLLDLYRRPADQLTLSNKWVWVAIIVFVNTIGSIIYLVVGRKPAAVAEVRSTASMAAGASNAADLLYGKDSDPR